MKNFAFEGIWLVSRRDRRARAIQFHPSKNLILGRNHTGKSSLIRCLFVTLGAQPQGRSTRWDPHCVSVVQFSVNRKKFLALHQSGSRALFDDQHSLIASAGSHLKWSREFSRAVGFNLSIVDKRSETVEGDPRFFFIPYYINQDTNWQSGWNTFAGMQQYNSPYQAVIDYFSGIKPPRFYELSPKRAQINSQVDVIKRDVQSLERARERFSKSMPSGPKVESTHFEEEIAELTDEVNELNKKQEQLRTVAIRQQELIARIHNQGKLADEALRVYDRDYTFLQEEACETLTCPVCGAEHSQPFVEFLSYAEDARVLRELVSRLQDDLVVVSGKHKKTLNELESLESHYQRVASILDKRRGDPKFQDVVNSLGAENACEAFREENAVLRRSLNQLLLELTQLDEALKALLSPKRSKDILGFFRESYKSALFQLNVMDVDANKARLSTRPNVSGSGGPRAILAYYSALWRTFRWEYGSFSVPLVIDAPNQQGQDDINLPTVLKFVANSLPCGSQIIVGSETDAGEKFDFALSLEEPYKLLREEEYGEVSDHIEPLMYAMREDLRVSSSELF